MATLRKTINSALKTLGVVGGHGASATNEELADALNTIYGLYHGMITNGMFGQMTDVAPSGDYVAGENQRVFRRYNDDQLIRIPDVVSTCGYVGYCLTDLEARANHNVPTTDYGRLPTRTRLHTGIRAIRDCSVVVINDEVAGETHEAIYQTGLKRWFVISELDYDFDLTDEHDVAHLNYILDQEAPLAHRDFVGFRSLVALNLADEFGAEPTQMMMLNANKFSASLTGRYAEPSEFMDWEFLRGFCGNSPQPCVDTKPVKPVSPPANLIVIDRGGATVVTITGTEELDLRFIVEGLFSVDSVNGVLTFTSENAKLLGNKRYRWVLKDISSDQVLDNGVIEATGFEA